LSVETVVRNLRLRRLQRGDESVLHRIAVDDADFGLAGSGEPDQPLDADDADAYLGDPSVLHWVAEEDAELLGFLQCQIVRKRTGGPVELLLYEIGVRAHARRRGVGRALIDEMVAWMRTHGVDEVWVLADNPGATAFYEAVGFDVAPEAPVYLTRTLA
jgi:ribosomal protein S18 acetylase RimI-like enzyme